MNPTTTSILYGVKSDLEAIRRKMDAYYCDVDEFIRKYSWHEATTILESDDVVEQGGKTSSTLQEDTPWRYKQGWLYATTKARKETDEMRWHSKQRGRHPQDPEWIDDYDPEEDYEDWLEEQERKEQEKREK